MFHFSKIFFLIHGLSTRSYPSQGRAPCIAAALSKKVSSSPPSQSSLNCLYPSTTPLHVSSLCYVGYKPKKKIPFASRWGQHMGTFFPKTGSLTLLPLADSTWCCCRFSLSCFSGPSSWTPLPGHSVFCRSADRSGNLPPVARIHKFPAFFTLHLCECVRNVLWFLQHIANDERGIDGQSLHVHPHFSA